MQTVIYSLTLLFTSVRILKYLAIINFLGSTQADLKKRPKVTLIQPISRGATNLELNLISRFKQAKLSKVQHLLVCDELDKSSVSLCKKMIRRYPKKEISLLVAKKESRHIASKTTKMCLALRKATEEFVAFIDDDIEIPPETLHKMIACLLEDSRRGAVFGLPIAASNVNIWSTINSMFVNSQAFFSYIPLTYFMPPYTITGHLFIVKKDVLESVGAFDGMNNNFDDDHNLAKRLINKGYFCMQTNIPYKVHNYIATFLQLSKQIKRWFMMPRQALVQNTKLKEKVITILISIDFFIPILIVFFAIVYFSFVSMFSLLIYILIFIFIDQVHLRKNLHQHFKWPNLILYPFVGFVIPLLAIRALLTPNTNVYWREQKLKLKNDGSFEVLE